MAKFLSRYLLVLLLLLPTTILFVGQSKVSSNMAFADDSMEDEEATVETDEGTADTQEEAGEEEADTGVTDQEQEEEEQDEASVKASPDASTFILFSKPTGTGHELPAGKTVQFLVGLTNKGYGEFTVDSLDASLRYPQDYTYYLQNYTTLTLNRVVESKRQATFEYSFVPSETFASRPFGLTINLNYRDGQNNQFQSAVFNETIQVVESEEGLDGETFFLYVFLAALGILLLVGAQQLATSFGRKRLLKPRPAVEMGTQKADIDYDWIPKETIKEMNRSPGRRSPRQSPRQRRSQRSSGSAEE